VALASTDDVQSHRLSILYRLCQQLRPGQFSVETLFVIVFALLTYDFQIGGAIGPHLFQSKYAPHYGVSFGIAMGFISACILATLGTWWLTRQTEQDIRRLKLARVSAQKRGETVLDDVVDNDLRKPVKGGSSSDVSA
jgi:hypothetical protein